MTLSRGSYGEESTMAHKRDISGQRFGRLVAEKIVGENEYPCGAKITLWECKCDCGNTTVLPISALTSGNTMSCGCLHRERVKSIKLSHGEAHTRLHMVWQQMKKRCHNPNDRSYKWYGAKGVTVCKEWDESYIAFRNWALENGYDQTAKRGLCTLDRINPFGNYEPNNCRWVDQKTQRRNVRSKYNYGYPD